MPLVAGRAGLLRVFVLADTGNMAVPVVRATLRDARGEIVLRRILAGWIPGVPTEIDEDNLESSWNLAIPGELIQPGLTLQAELLAIRSGVGIGVIPDFAMSENTDLVKIMTDVQGPKIDVFFVYPEELRNSKRVAVFRDFLLARLAELH